MALFVSPFREFSLVVQKTRSVPNQFTGEPVIHQKGIVANFRWAGRGLEPWAIAEATERFNFKGLGHNEDGLRRLSFYDTEAEAAAGTFDEAAHVAGKTREEMHDLVVDTLRKKASDYFEAVRPALSAPWPNYAKARNAKAIAAIVTDLGLEVGSVIEYERQNENREAVIEALEGIGSEPVEEEVEVSA